MSFTKHVFKVCVCCCRIATLGLTYIQEKLRRKIHTRLLNLKGLSLLRMSMDNALLESEREYKAAVDTQICLPHPYMLP